jgi:hypothetical protein
MNSLSWMIYFADVSDSLSTIGKLIAVGAGLGGAITALITAVKTDVDNIGRVEKLNVLSTGWQAGKGFFKVGIVAALVVTPIPSKETIYAIAASEMGEDVLNSPTGGKAMQALNAWLDRQIEGDPGKVN